MEEELQRMLRALEACQKVFDTVPGKYQSKEFKYVVQNTKRIIDGYYIARAEISTKSNSSV